MPTRGQLRAGAARLMGLLIAEGTTTLDSTGAASNSTTVLYDVSSGNGGLKSDSDSPNRFDGAFFLFTGGPASGQWRELSKGNYTPSAGSVKPATAFTTAPTAAGGDTYEIYAGLTPDQWSLRDNNTIIDAALTRCRFQRRSPITLVTDGDMEAAGVSSWTAVNATITKSTTDTVTYGAQSLKVTNTSANGYAQSVSIGVIPGHGYMAVVDYRGTTTTISTATLQVWDITNNALITTGTDQDSGINFEGGRSSTSFTAPTTCYQVAFRLVGAESNAVIAWDDLVVMTAGRRRYSSPAWILTRNQINSYLLRDGARPFEDVWQDVGWPLDIQEDPTALQTFVVDLPQLARGLSGTSFAAPVYMLGTGAYGPQTSTADATVTACPYEWGTRSAARAAWQIYGRELEGFTLQRAVSDRAIIEKLAKQADDMYMPVFASDVGMPYGYSGTEITRLP